MAVALFLNSAVAASAEARSTAVEPQAPLGASASFRSEMQLVRSRLDVGDLAGAGSALAGLSPVRPLEKYMAGSLALELAAKRGDLAAERTAIAEILSSGAVPAGQLAYFNHIAGYLAYQSGAIDNAVVFLNRARELGDTRPEVALLLVECLVRQRKLGDAGNLLNQTIAAQTAAGQPVPASWYDREASLAYARKDWAALAAANAVKLSEPEVEAADWRTAIVTYINGARPDGEAELDLYRLQELTGALASERDYQNYAKLAADRGYSAEAERVLAEGQASGRLTQTDPVALALSRSLRSKTAVNLMALRALAGKSAGAASAAKAAQDGDALLAGGKFAEAVPYYQAALAKGAIERDRVDTRLGIALARAGDLEGAQAAFARAGGRWGQIGTYWSAWVKFRRARAIVSSGSAQAAISKPAF